MMELVESLIVHVAENVLDTLEIARRRNTELSAVLIRLDSAIQKSSLNLVNENNRQNVAANEKNVERSLLSALGSWAEQCDALADKVGFAPYSEVAGQVASFTEDMKRRFAQAVSTLPEVFRLDAANFSAACRPLEIILSELKELQNNNLINLTPPWRRVKYKDLIREKAGADWFELTPQARRERALSLGAEIGKDHEDFEVTGAVFEKLIEPTLIQPTFVTHLPKELVPLAKLSPEDPTTVEVFECCINGQEIAPAYSEQNDPIAQRERLEHQAGGEQQKLDEDFLIALEHGMPPAGGMGMGIDRLCMMLLGQESIRDVILFPQMKPKV
jgi:lysyl-tRNA synthetase class II